MAVRLAGEPLHLVLSIGEPTTGLFARAFLTDSAGGILGAVDLSNDGECFSDHIEPMPNVSQVIAKYKVFKDAGYLEEDCDFPWVIDQFDLQSTVPVALAGAETITAKMEDVDMSVDFSGELSATIEDDSLNARIEEIPELEVELKGELVSNIETEDIDANFH